MNTSQPVNKILLVIIGILIIINLVTVTAVWASGDVLDRGGTVLMSTSVPPTNTNYQDFDILPCGETKRETCYQFYRIENNNLNIALWISNLANKNVTDAEINNIHFQCKPFGNVDDSIICTGPLFDSGMWKMQLFSNSESLYTGNILIDLKFATSTATATSTTTSTPTITSTPNPTSVHITYTSKPTRRPTHYP